MENSSIFEDSQAASLDPSGNDGVDGPETPETQEAANRLEDFSDEEIDSFRYGDARYSDFLRLTGEAKNWEPIENVRQYCMSIFTEKFGADSGIYCGQTLSMAVSEEATREEALAGYILTFNLIAQLSRQMEASGTPRAQQADLLAQCYNHVAERYPWSFYQIETYFHNHQGMRGGHSGCPGRANQDT